MKGVLSTCAQSTFIHTCLSVSMYIQVCAIVGVFYVSLTCNPVSKALSKTYCLFLPQMKNMHHHRAPLDMEMKNIACHGCQTPYPWSDSAADISYKCLFYCLGIQRERFTDLSSTQLDEKKDGSRSQSLFPRQHQHWGKLGDLPFV